MANMQLIYGLARFNSLKANRSKKTQFPNWVILYHKTFIPYMINSINLEAFLMTLRPRTAKTVQLKENVFNEITNHKKGLRN